MAEEWLGCSACIYYKNNGTCDAFPVKIPIPFVSGEVPHTKVVSGQKGNFVYTPKK